MKCQLMNTGRGALVNVVSGGPSPQIVSYDIGSSFNFSLDINATSVVPNPPVYSGTYQTVYKTIVTDDEIILTVFLGSLLSFQVGNVMLKMADGTPFIWMDLERSYFKVAKNVSTQYAGDLYFLPFVIKYPGISILMNLSNLADFYAQGPAITDILALNDVYRTAVDQQQINNSTFTFNLGRPIYVTDTFEGKWWGTPFSMSLDDVRKWQLDGGNAGDNYIYSPQLIGSP